MTDATITRTKIIVVSEVETNTFGDLTFTDKEGGQYKVSNKRKGYFEKVVLPGLAVKLNYAVFKGTEYIYSATQVKNMIPEKPGYNPPPPATTPPASPPPVTQTTVTDWVAKDRITRRSIERQTSLNAAVKVAELLGADKATTDNIISTARAFEAYLEGREPGKSRLVEQAKEMGATEVKV